MSDAETIDRYSMRAGVWMSSIARVAGIPPRYERAIMADLDKAMGEGIKNAYECCRAVIFQGPNGSGKTHAACAYLRGTYLASGRTPLFVYVPDLIGQARQAIAEDHYESWLKRFKEFRYLVLDDFAAIRKTDFAADTIMRIVDMRYTEDRLYTSITTDVPLTVLHEENARISGRIWEQAEVILMPEVRPERDVNRDRIGRAFGVEE